MSECMPSHQDHDAFGLCDERRQEQISHVSVALSMAEKIKPQGGDAPYPELLTKYSVGPAILGPEEAMTEDDYFVGGDWRREKHGADSPSVGILQRKPFLHTTLESCPVMIHASSKATTTHANAGRPGRSREPCRVPVTAPYSMTQIAKPLAWPNNWSVTPPPNIRLMREVP